MKIAKIKLESDMTYTIKLYVKGELIALLECPDVEVQLSTVRNEFAVDFWDLSGEYINSLYVDAIQNGD